MSHKLHAFFVTLVVVSTLAISPVAAAAQDGENTNQTNPTPTNPLGDDQDATPTPTPEQDTPTNVTEQLGDLRIHKVDWFSDEKMVRITATWRGTLPTTVSVIQMLDPDSETQSLGIEQVRVRPDETVTIAVDLSKMDSVVVSTPESVDRGEAIMLSPPGMFNKVEVPLRYGVFLGILLGGIGTVLAVRRRYAKTDEVEKIGGGSGI